MSTLDHRAPSHHAAVALDDKLRGLIHGSLRRDVDSVTDLVAMLRDVADYRDRLTHGRLRGVKRLLGRLLKPIVRPQVEFNLIMVEHLGRIENSLVDVRHRLDSISRGDDAK